MNSLRRNIVGLCAAVIVANIAAWLWAVAAFREFPLLLGTAALAYSLGLRHAFDADHISAIDNVTRKLVQEGKRPIGVGLFFSLGHSTIVVCLSIAVALTTTALQTRFEAFKSVSGIFSSLISSVFLFAIALANAMALAATYRVFQRMRNGEGVDTDDFDLTLSSPGLLGRLLRGVFRIITSSWQMYPIGLLFGLGFDTATEIGLLGISAHEASGALPIVSILVLPALFTAGMTLLDTLDSILMLGAYGWAFVNPMRKLYYNLIITACSVLVAVIVGGVDALNLLGNEFGLAGSDGFWSAIGTLSDNLGWFGYLIAGMLIILWAVAYAVYRIKGCDIEICDDRRASPPLRLRRTRLIIQRSVIR
jgi:high-affinity nickel-transport protein